MSNPLFKNGQMPSNPMQYISVRLRSTKSRVDTKDILVMKMAVMADADEIIWVDIPIMRLLKEKEEAVTGRITVGCKG